MGGGGGRYVMLKLPTGLLILNISKYPLPSQGSCIWPFILAVQGARSFWV